MDSREYGGREHQGHCHFSMRARKSFSNLILRNILIEWCFNGNINYPSIVVCILIFSFVRPFISFLSPYPSSPLSLSFSLSLCLFLFLGPSLRPSLCSSIFLSISLSPWLALSPPSLSPSLFGLPRGKKERSVNT